MPVEKVDEEKCIGCRQCVITCPMDVFRFNEDTYKSQITYQQDCQICHLCRMFCPVDAITITPYKCVRPMVGWA